MRFSAMYTSLRTIYQRTTPLEGTVHLCKGSWKMLKIVLFSAYWRHNLGRVGRNLTIFPKVRIDFPKNVNVSDDFVLGQSTVLRSENPAATLDAGNRIDVGMHCHIDYSGGLTLGDRVVISDGASIHTHNHGLSPFNAPTYRRLVIGSDVWIGGGATILPQVSSIGDGAVIGACAVVTKDVKPWCVVAGNPARVIKNLDPPKQKKHI